MVYIHLNLNIYMCVWASLSVSLLVFSLPLSVRVGMQVHVRMEMYMYKETTCLHLCPEILGQSMYIWVFPAMVVPPQLVRKSGLWRIAGSVWHGHGPLILPWDGRDGLHLARCSTLAYLGNSTRKDAGGRSMRTSGLGKGMTRSLDLGSP